MKRKPYNESFSDVEVVVHGCLFYIDGAVSFDLHLGEGYFDFDTPDIDIKAVTISPSGDEQTDKDFIKFFWAVGWAEIESAIGKWLDTYHSSLLENEPDPDEKYDNEKHG